jgi:hypothetical protein
VCTPSPRAALQAEAAAGGAVLKATVAFRYGKRLSSINGFLKNQKSNSYLYLYQMHPYSTAVFLLAVASAVTLLPCTLSLRVTISNLLPVSIPFHFSLFAFAALSHTHPPPPPTALPCSAWILMEMLSMHITARLLPPSTLNLRCPLTARHIPSNG